MAATKKRKREKKAANPKDMQSTPTVDSNNLPSGTVEMVPKCPVATVVTNSLQPLSKKLKGPSPPVRAVNKQK